MSQNKIAHKVQNLQSSAIRELLKHSKMEGVISLGGGIPNPALFDREGLKIAEDRSITALFVANDQMALGVLRAFHEAGVGVPQDISVVGFDDQPEAAYFIPPLTTVAQDFEELGQRCIGLLLDRLESGKPGAPVTVAPRLVVRSTTAAVRS